MKGIILQARLGSTRFPHKIVRPFFAGKSILDLLIEKVQCLDNDLKIIIATSDSPENDILENIADKYNIACFRGSEDDVLARFIEAAQKYSVSEIIRVCSDNPFLELESIRKLVSHAYSLTEKKDYISFCISGTPSIKTHYGFWTEYVTLEALEKVTGYTSETLYHEHVTNYIYTHPELFSVDWINGPTSLEGNNQIRLTIDTEEDFNLARSVYEKLCSSNPYPRIEEIVTFLNAHPEYYESMKKQIVNNSK